MVSSEASSDGDDSTDHHHFSLELPLLLYIHTESKIKGMDMWKLIQNKKEEKARTRHVYHYCVY